MESCGIRKVSIGKAIFIESLLTTMFAIIIAFMLLMLHYQHSISIGASDGKFSIHQSSKCKSCKEFENGMIMWKWEHMELRK